MVTSDFDDLCELFEAISFTTVTRVIQVSGNYGGKKNIWIVKIRSSFLHSIKFDIIFPKGCVFKNNPEYVSSVALFCRTIWNKSSDIKVT